MIPVDCPPTPSHPNPCCYTLLAPEWPLLHTLGQMEGPCRVRRVSRTGALGHLMAQVHSDKCCSRSWGCCFHTALTMCSQGGGAAAALNSSTQMQGGLSSRSQHMSRVYYAETRPDPHTSPLHTRAAFQITFNG